MFLHNFKYSFLTLFRNKMLIFWTFAFPIILATFFMMAFSNIEKKEQLDIIDIAIVENEEFTNNKILNEAFKVLGDKNSKEQLFNIKYTKLEDAKKLLTDGEISGYLLVKKESTEVIVSTSGVNQTILKQVTDEIIQNQKIMEKIVENETVNGIYNIDYNKIYENAIKTINEAEVRLENVSNKNLSYTMIEFYSLIAMACLYGGILGLSSINEVQANMSNNGKRVQVSPVSKSKIILGSTLASYIAQLIGLAILFIYTVFVLKIDYGSNLLLIILLSLVGSLAGLSIGILVGSGFKTNENAKTGIILSYTMFCCFLSGMMGITMKYIIDKNIPIINKLNPASMIVDGFYSLYYYDTLDRYFFNVISLVIFACILILISIYSLRRQKYDSI